MHFVGWGAEDVDDLAAAWGKIGPGGLLLFRTLSPMLSLLISHMYAVSLLFCRFVIIDIISIVGNRR